MDLVIRVFLPASVGIIMLSLGLGLSIKDFTRIARWPKSFFVGLACQTIMIPVISFGVVKAFGITGSIAVGVMLLAACPGGNTSNLFTKFARGDVALSISMTSVSSLLSVITVPVVVKWSEYYFVENTAVFLDLRGIALRAFLLSVLPISIGIFLRHVATPFADRAGAVLTKVSIGLLLMIVTGAVVGNWTSFMENLQLLGGSLTVLFFLLTALGFLVPLALGCDRRHAKTISIETGVQNGALGITVATLLTYNAAGFNDYALASAIYGVLVYFAICPVLVWFRSIK